MKDRVLLILYVVMLILVPAWMAYDKYKFKISGIETTAKIIESEYRRRTSHRGRTWKGYDLIITYLDQTAQKHRTYISVPVKHPDEKNFGAGASISVFYLADNPNRVEVASRVEDNLGLKILMFSIPFFPILWFFF